MSLQSQRTNPAFADDARAYEQRIENLNARLRKSETACGAMRAALARIRDLPNQRHIHCASDYANEALEIAREAASDT
jgi:hypothetical protein